MTSSIDSFRFIFITKHTGTEFMKGIEAVCERTRSLLEGGVTWDLLLSGSAVQRE